MTTEQFLEFLERSGLYSAERVAELAADAQAQGLIDAEAEPYAKRLLQQRVITPFQADRLLRGKYRNFIINDKFRVLDRWDAGDLGIFFRCEHLTLRKNVTLRSHAAFTEEQENDVNALLDRIRELAQITDPHLGRIIDIERVNNQPLLVMEDISGPSVEEWVMRQGPLPVEDACSFTTQAALGLQTLHDAGWLHGEARPARMVFDPQRTVKLLDASLSDWLGNPRQGSRSRSRTGERGFPLWDYSAPEVLAKKPNLDGRADLYSLGCTLYHLLAGRPPFATFAATEKVKAHQFAEPPALAKARADVSPKLLGVMNQLLAKRPDDRPGSAMEVAQALLPWSRSHLPQVSQAMLGIGSYRGDLAEEVEQRRAKTSGQAPGTEGRRAAPKAKKSEKGGFRLGLPTLLAALFVGLAFAALIIVYVSSSKGESYGERAQRIRQMLTNQQIEQAASLIQESLDQAQGNNADATRYYNLLAQLKNPQLFTELNRLRPNDPELTRRYADYCYAEKTWPMAALLYGNVLEKNPADRVALERKAECQMVQGRWADAVTDYRKLQELDSGESKWWLYHGLMLARANRWVEFRAQLTAMWNRFKNGDRPADIANIALLASVARDPQVAEINEIEERARSLAAQQRNQPLVAFSIGALQYRIGRPGDAAKDLRQLYDKSTNWTSRQICLPMLGLALLADSKKDAAMKTYNEVDQWAKAERERLELESPRGDMRAAQVTFIPITSTKWDWQIFDLLMDEYRQASRR